MLNAKKKSSTLSYSAFAPYSHCWTEAAYFKVKVLRIYMYLFNKSVFTGLQFTLVLLKTLISWIVYCLIILFCDSSVL